MQTPYHCYTKNYVVLFISNNAKIKTIFLSSILPGAVLNVQGLEGLIVRLPGSLSGKLPLNTCNQTSLWFCKVWPPY